MIKKEIPELEKLKEFKEQSGWTYQRIAHLIGCHYQSCINWINGTYRPSPMAIEKIKTFLNKYSYK
ncbi:hypothetical protein ES703_21635 [subsurface metagenome]